MTGRLSMAAGAKARGVLSVLMVALLLGGAYVLWPRPQNVIVSGHFSSAIGLYPGDQVKIAGVPVGSVVAIQPRPEDTVITMSVRPGVRIPADASAIIIAPNLVAARFVEFAPQYTSGPLLVNGATIPGDRTAVPVEWDQVKDELTKLATQLGPGPDSLQGPLATVVNQAADTFDGQGDTFRRTVRELSQTAGRLGDSRDDLLGTVKNLHTLIDALSQSNDQIVQFTNHVAAVSQVIADSSTHLDDSLAALNQALNGIRGLLGDSNTQLIGQVDKLRSFTDLLTEHSDDIQQVLHLAPTGLANFYNIYNPAQSSIGAILTAPNLANPVQFICGTFDTVQEPDYNKRAEICRERMAPVLRRITMNYPPILFHPINTITAYKGQMIYDTPETEAKARTPVSQLQWMPLPGVTPPRPSPDADLSSMLLPPPLPAEAPPTDTPGVGAPPAPIQTDTTPPLPPLPTGPR